MSGVASIADILTGNLDVWTSAIERRSSAGRGRSKKFSLYGIEKLRSLILDLAVRGVLVPQEADDEPASALLKTRHRTDQRGPTSKKVVPQVTSTNGNVWPFAIPDSWAWARLGLVTNYGDTEKADPGDVAPEIWVLELEDIEKGTSRLIERVRHAERPYQSQKNRFDTRDVIYGKLRPYLDKVIIADEPGVCTTEMVPIRAFPGLTPEYLRLFLKSPFFIDLATNSTHGMNLPRLGTDKARAAPISLPPLAEQRRIFEKVDELMTLCDALEAESYRAIEAHELLVSNLLATLTRSRNAEELTKNWARIEAHFDTLFTTEASIDQLKQTILQFAVTGKLARQDRNEDCSNQRRLRPDAAAETYDTKAYATRAKKFSLPVCWTIEPLSRVSSHIVDCPHTTPKWTTEGYLCAKSEQIMPGYLDLRKPNYVSEETFIERIERLKPRPGDILFKREGGILGVACRIPEGTVLCLGQRLMLIRVNDSILPSFLELVLNAPWTTDYAREMTTGGAAPRVNMTVVRAFPIPLPPKPEQQRILDKFSELSSLCELLKKQLSTALAAEVKIANAITSKLMA
ncbi:restriction endonuclease subunit S [Methylobacterium sp. J-026]|uniref:restriction endonuclease subunit S n=1 Tax=Methylobacterium sp. J-026 TaxID=2836624 RepID=UPI001FBA4AD4|nr:restriction endonuclease subunit S [Methylobacterium sp. J-026]MCJ2137413.1 restriction endonuclease subunit S [Methylobacterium sp. J-026]